MDHRSKLVTPPDGLTAPTRPKPGIKEVAQHAGVAISSVSRVLSGHPDVSAAMRDLVNNAVLELGYRPNALARGLRSQRSMSVGFAVADLANPIFADIVRGAERELRASGYSLLLTNSEGDRRARRRQHRTARGSSGRWHAPVAHAGRQRRSHSCAARQLASDGAPRPRPTRRGQGAARPLRSSARHDGCGTITFWTSATVTSQW